MMNLNFKSIIESENHSGPKLGSSLEADDENLGRIKGDQKGVCTIRTCRRSFPIFALPYFFYYLF